MRPLFTLPLLLLSVSIATAQSGVELSGTVASEEGGPLIGASVALLPPGADATAQPLTGAITDRTGHFAIRSLAPGRYTVVIRSLGHLTERREITVTAAIPRSLTFTLAVAPLPLGQIVVTGQATGTEQRRLTTSVETITRL